MTSAQQRAVESLVKFREWMPCPMGPCGARPARRGRVAEQMVEMVAAELAAPSVSRFHDIDDPMEIDPPRKRVAPPPPWDLPFNPVCAVHGKRLSEHYCLYCCLCFKSLTVDECSTNPQGQKQNVCKECAKEEAERVKQESEIVVYHVCGDDCSATRSPKMFRKLSQTEYGFTLTGSLANGALYVNDDGLVRFLTDAEVHRFLTDAPSKQPASVPGPFSCHVHVASVYSNTGGFGSTATLEFEEGGGIDIRPGGSMTDTIQIQVTADTEALVKPGAVIKFTLSAIEETP